MPKAFSESALRSQVPQEREERFGVYPNSLFIRERRGEDIYTKAPSRNLHGTSSHGIGV